MKFICIKSHTQPGAEPGKFDTYEAGDEYDLAEASEAYFQAVHGTTDGNMDQGDHVAVNQKNDADTVGSLHKGRKK